MNYSCHSKDRLKMLNAKNALLYANNGKIR